MKMMPPGFSILKTRKKLLVQGNDTFWTVFSFFLAYFLRFNFSIPEAEVSLLLKSLPLLVVFRVISFFIFRLYDGVFRYASVDDLVRIIKAVTLGSLFFVSSVAFVFHFKGFPRSVLLIDWFIILIFLGGSRFLYRIFRETYSFPPSPQRVLRRVLIIGAGDVGEMILRSIKREKDIPYEVVGFLDDDPDKIGRRIHGVEVLGKVSNLSSWVEG
nr:polysaccharide biosynthesis protein [Candidatus Aenigmarchaeota archaeon]